ncbi:MAG: hypothetical protein JWL62_2476, partial [Hyphomicrobiales bacterium]|nr:hypothetical protein [Hyphomicrobiales bacterium]
MFAVRTFAEFEENVMTEAYLCGGV